jgi:ArsR family transcriptional regulator
MELHRIFRALADPNRLRILNLLLEGPCWVCDLDAVLHLPQPLVSRHLAYLRNAGLVRDCRQGIRVQYSAVLDTPLTPGLTSFLRQAFSMGETFQEDKRRWRQQSLTGLVNVAAPSGVPVSRGAMS